jgi:23S rRNA-/tRNA-specific pseudouridylate synthase
MCPARPAPLPAHVVVVDEGPHHAVFVKPPGMTVVAGRGVPRPTLLDIATERFGGAVRPVHRIDRVTSGLVVFARSTFAQQALSDAFRRHLIDKRYLALVEGNPAWEKLDIDARLTRIDDPDAKKGPLAWQTIDENGIRALTRVRVLARGDGVALLECRPETGRMHQIRVHLAHVGHPIVGDSGYGAKLPFVDGAVGLLAFAISFPLPGGGRRFVASTVPPQFTEAFARLGLNPTKAIEELRERFLKTVPPKPPAAKPAPAKAPPSKAGPRPTAGRPSKSGGRDGPPQAPAPSSRAAQAGRPPRTSRGEPVPRDDRAGPRAASPRSDRARRGDRPSR